MGLTKAQGLGLWPDQGAGSLAGLDTLTHSLSLPPLRLGAGSAARMLCGPAHVDKDIVQSGNPLGLGVTLTHSGLSLETVRLKKQEAEIRCKGP